MTSSYFLGMVLSAIGVALICFGVWISFTKRDQPNVAIGTGALTSITTGVSSQSIGPTTGSDNFVFGANSAVNLTSGSRNMVIGKNTAYSLATGNDNFLVGNDIDVPSTDTSNYVNINNHFIMQDGVILKDDGTSREMAESIQEILREALASVIAHNTCYGDVCMGIPLNNVK